MSVARQLRRVLAVQVLTVVVTVAAAVGILWREPDYWPLAACWAGLAGSWSSRAWRTWRALRSPFLYLAELAELCASKEKK